MITRIWIDYLTFYVIWCKRFNAQRSGKMKKVLYFLMGSALLLSVDSRAQLCTLGAVYMKCSAPNCSSSQVYVTCFVNAVAGYFPRMGTANCGACGGIVPICEQGPAGCYETELQRPDVQERLEKLNETAPVYVVNCDGWVRRFHPPFTESAKPAKSTGGA